jgi:hypothetical protein
MANESLKLQGGFAQQSTMNLITEQTSPSEFFCTRIYWMQGGRLSRSWFDKLATNGLTLGSLGLSW